MIHDFHGWVLLFIRKLVDQGLLVVKKKSSLRMFYGHNHDLVYCYIIYVLQITTDIFLLSCLSFLVQNFRIYHQISLTIGLVTWITRRVPKMDQKLLILPDHRSSLRVLGELKLLNIYFFVLYILCFQFLFFIFCHYILSC